MIQRSYATVERHKQADKSPFSLVATITKPEDDDTSQDDVEPLYTNRCFFTNLYVSDGNLI